MAFSDEFVNNYAGFQDDNRVFKVPKPASVATYSVDIVNTYNPLKTAAGRTIYVVPYIGNIPHSTSFLQVAAFNETPLLDRQEITYNEGFQQWDGTD